MKNFLLKFFVKFNQTKKPKLKNYNLNKIATKIMIDQMNEILCVRTTNYTNKNSVITSFYVVEQFILLQWRRRKLPLIFKAIINTRSNEYIYSIKVKSNAWNSNHAKLKHTHTFNSM